MAELLGVLGLGAAGAGAAGAAGAAAPAALATGATAAIPVGGGLGAAGMSAAAPAAAGAGMGAAAALPSMASSVSPAFMENYAMDMGTRPAFESAMTTPPSMIEQMEGKLGINIPNSPKDMMDLGKKGMKLGLSSFGGKKEPEGTPLTPLPSQSGAPPWNPQMGGPFARQPLTRRAAPQRPVASPLGKYRMDYEIG